MCWTIKIILPSFFIVYVRVRLLKKHQPIIGNAIFQVFKDLYFFFK